uniref:MalT-like TPR region domain-containing protein n=1 Tax=Guillardia theta TaxID=55529 RepID=A0A7S4L9B6_GUITH|mmetsp:Transcript_40247/g.126703  ORF Transcript_40247/g.126703 Transcript_40247/m.126703 type:complete len:1241 (+) Transcript_40247:106-3828(+)
MAQIYVNTSGRANKSRPVSAVEKSRIGRSGRDGGRPSSAGVLRFGATFSGNQSNLISESDSSRASEAPRGMRLTDTAKAEKILNPYYASSRASSSASSTSSRLKNASLNSSKTSGRHQLWMIGPKTTTKAAWDPDETALHRDARGKEMDSAGFKGSDRMSKLAHFGDTSDKQSLLEVEEQLRHLANTFGSRSKQALQTSEKLGRLYNSRAMVNLQRGENSIAFILLQCAQMVISDFEGSVDLESLKALTYNNLGCYFRREGMPMEALKWLRQAHDIEERIGEVSSRGSTFLNLCAVYSLLGKHLNALNCATEALKYLDVQSRKPEVKGHGSERTDRASMLAIAYHNIAVEQEYLNRYEDAIRSYQSALNVLEVQGLDKSSLAGKLRLALTSAQNSFHANAVDDDSVDSRNSTVAMEKHLLHRGNPKPSKAPSQAYVAKPALGSNVGIEEARSPKKSRANRTPSGSSDAKINRDGDRDIKYANAGRKDPSPTTNFVDASSAEVQKNSFAYDSNIDWHIKAGAVNEQHRLDPDDSRNDDPSHSKEVKKREKSPDSSSSREKGKRPLSAARLPLAEDESSESLIREEPSKVRRHSRKTARPRTAGRERMADDDREELLAMTDPSSTDAGEYENVEGDAEAESDAESALPGASKKHEGDRHDESCDFDVACANDDSQDADLINKNRPLSAARPANGAPEPASRARQSRKTARPRTAGRDRMHQEDREDLLVLSSASDEGDAYEYLSGDDDDEPSVVNARNGNEGRAMKYESSDVVKEMSSKLSGHSQNSAMKEKRNPSSRPLSAGVSFGSISSNSHASRPQSAPSRRPGRFQSQRDRSHKDKGLEKDEEGLKRSLVQPAPGTTSKDRVRPADSGQHRLTSRESSKGEEGFVDAEGPETSSQGHYRDAFIEEAEESDGDELDTKGILMEQTRALSEELQKAKQREQELEQRLARLEASAVKGGKEEAKVEDGARASRAGVDRAESQESSKTFFGLPEIGLDSIDEDSKWPRSKPAHHLLVHAKPPLPSTTLRVPSKFPAAWSSPQEDVDEIHALSASLRILANKSKDSSGTHFFRSGTSFTPVMSASEQAWSTPVATDSLRPEGRSPWGDASLGPSARKNSDPVREEGMAELSDTSSRASSQSTRLALRPLPARRNKRRTGAQQQQETEREEELATQFRGVRSGWEEAGTSKGTFSEVRLACCCSSHDDSGMAGEDKESCCCSCAESLPRSPGSQGLTRCCLRLN